MAVVGMDEADRRSRGETRLTLAWKDGAVGPVQVRRTSMSNGASESASDPCVLIVDAEGLREEPTAAPVRRLAVDGLLITLGDEEPRSNYEDREPASVEVPRLEIREPSGEVRTVWIELEDGAALVVGRGGPDRPCDLVIADTRMSGIHFEVVWKAGKLRLRDLGSRHGTAINGDRVTGQRLLRHLDEIVAGRTVITVRHPLDGLQGDTIQPDSTPPPLPPAMPQEGVPESASGVRESSPRRFGVLPSVLVVVIVVGIAVFLVGAALLVFAMSPEWFGLGEEMQP